ncbi:phage tail tube protein [Paenalcaligenes niemegkensis]|uniref:phage tail tube protein n=1 Tax=Paenalcaligenes niemegkensis TaxID=2895469 RepID=UPI001EE7D41A|nr:phage tail tube protein [Paenalcaligenes niemegkensis]MCQ9618397.1 phage tail tube protein [Paenalcaligenes niemegkensis]
MSSGAKVVTHYIAETVPGTTPTTGTWKTARLTSNTLSPTPTTEVSDEITDTRLSQGSVVTGLNIAGDLVGEMSFGTFDEFLAALFYGNWNSDVLTIGSVRQTFSVQKAFTDVGTFHLFKGVHAATGSIEIPEEGKIILTIGGQALDYEDGTSTFVTGTPEAPTTTPFMSSVAVGDVKVDGVSMAGSACVSAMTINIDNTLQVQRCLGSGKLGPGALIETEAAITGTITLAWSARAYDIWKEQMTRKAFGVEFPLVDSLGNTYTLDFPAVEFDGELPSGGKRDLIQASLNWTVSKIAPTITREAAAEGED